VKKNRNLLVGVIIVFFIFFNVKSVIAKELTITAQSAVLIDADTGAILFGKNHLQQRPPASTTKILTAILAIEKGNLKDSVEISNRASRTGEARLNLIAGEKISLENLLYGALLKSGNDACVAIAEHISPSVEEFVDLMNLKANLLGCNNSCFINTNGLPVKNHYSSALDLAIIARYALKNPKFAEIVSTPLKTLNWEESTRKRTIKNTNRLLLTYPGANGVKTGTTVKAGQCLVASACRENRNLIAVVLKSTNRFSDATRLLNYGFSNFRNIEIVRTNKISKFRELGKEITLKTGKDLIITVKKNQVVNIIEEVEIDKSLLNRSIFKDQVLGYIKYFNNGKKIGQVPLLAVNDIQLDEISSSNINKIWQLLKGKLYLEAN